MSIEAKRVYEIYDEAKNKILLYIEAAVSPHQFRALRKLILDTLGKNGAEGKVRDLLERDGQAGTETSKGVVDHE